jgi:hypothetical protein
MVPSTAGALAWPDHIGKRPSNRWEKGGRIDDPLFLTPDGETHGMSTHRGWVIGRDTNI